MYARFENQTVKFSKAETFKNFMEINSFFFYFLFKYTRLTMDWYILFQVFVYIWFKQQDSVRVWIHL